MVEGASLYHPKEGGKLWRELRIHDGIGGRCSFAQSSVRGVGAGRQMKLCYLPFAQRITNDSSMESWRRVPQSCPPDLARDSTSGSPSWCFGAPLFGDTGPRAGAKRGTGEAAGVVNWFP